MVHTYGVELQSTALKVEYLYKLFGTIGQGRFLSSPLLIFSLMYLYQCGRIDTYVILWVII